MYKGQTVAVNPVDKPEVNLTSQDLVELVNVCRISFICHFRVSATILYTLHTKVVKVFYSMQQHATVFILY